MKVLVVFHSRTGHTRRRAKLLPSAKHPGDYALVVIGTPVWRVSLSSPVRTYLEDNAAHLRHVAFFCTFCTMGRFGSDRVFRQMQEVCGRTPVATFARTERR